MMIWLRNSSVCEGECLNAYFKEVKFIFGNEALNRATGSFKDGIILGYYIFYFKNIQVAYRDKSRNIIVEGYDKSPFK